MKNFLLAKLFGNTERSIANWRIEKRPIIDLIESCFSEDEIIDFVQSGNIPIKQNSLDVSEHYSLVKRALKTRVEEFRETIGFQDTAYVKYLLIYWRAIISNIHCNKIEKKTLLKELIEKTDLKFGIGDMGNFEKIEQLIKERIIIFYENLSDIEIEFIFQYPKEYEEIIHASFSKFELFVLRLPPSDL